MGKFNDENSTESVQSKNSSLLATGLFLVIASVVIATGWLMIQWLYAPGNFPIRKIELVNKMKHQKSNELQKVAASAIEGGFFSMDVDLFREELLLLPWVKNVSVRKIWPDKLLVSITERRPVVRWLSIDGQSGLNQTRYNTADNNTGRETFLSDKGIVFSPQVTRDQQSEFSKLPLFSGPYKSAEKVLKQCLMYIQMVKSINTEIVRCTMDARHTWKLEMISGLELNIGKNDAIQRLQRFVAVFSRQLQQYLKYVAYADLRYSNGISVKWIGESVDKADGVRLN